MVDFSVVVPVYNAEKYLERCLDSIIKQTYSHFTCILIDDGSEDNSGAICDEWSRRDERFRVIRQMNSGPGVARNRGIAESKGEYLLFIDSDDFWVDSLCFEKIAGTLSVKKPDVLVFGFFDFIEATNRLRDRSVLPPFDNNSTARHLIINDGFKATMWDKAVRRDVVKKYGMCFSEGLRIGEDKQFNADILRHPLYIEYLPVPLYVYRKNPLSIAQSYRKQIHETCKDLYRIYDKVLATGEDIGDKERERLYFAFWAHEFLADAGKFSPVYSEYKEKITPFFRLWDWKLSRSVKLAYWFHKFLGKRITVLFLSFLLALKHYRNTKKWR